MKNYIKKHISLLLAVMIVIVSVSISLFVFANDEVEINAVNFPDDNFREAIALMYDTNKDGVLSASERNVDSMIVSGIIETLAFEKGVSEDDLPVNNLMGIELFENLKTVRCSGVGQMETLDLSQLNKLESVTCNDLGLKNLILPGTSTLKEVNACSNEFETLDFSIYNTLTRIHCYGNDCLTALNVRGLRYLEDLRCDGCALESLDLSTNIRLKYLNCSYNRLTKLDLSNNQMLENIGNYNLGFQEADVAVTANDDFILVPMDLEDDRVITDTEDVEFADGAFYTEDFAAMADGIDYTYSTGLADDVNLTVHLNVTENEHYNKLLSYNVEDNCGEVGCAICKEKACDVSFADSINAVSSSENYSIYLDLNNDGIINAKDYAKLLKKFN